MNLHVLGCTALFLCGCTSVFLDKYRDRERALTSDYNHLQVALSRGGGRIEELEQQLQQAVQQAADEHLRCEEHCSRLQQLQETLQIKDTCLKDAIAALNEAKSETRRTAALLQVSDSMKVLAENHERVT